MTDRKKATYVGAPAIFALETACGQINEAFGGCNCYLVGSSMERPDWRDVDVRYIMDDEQFEREFPDAGQCWEQDAKWLLLTVAISERLSKVTGLPIDFQIQPRTHANDRHKGSRSAIGIKIAKPVGKPHQRVLGSFGFPQGRGRRREVAGDGGIAGSEAVSGVLK